ncbi:MAG: radical SAM protein [Lachnospiraceae bacterium]|nr:radical SAM protein [Lachnospiraceae bacterium]
MEELYTGRIKPSFDENRQRLGNILPLKVPFNVLLDSSEVCNFKCSYCFRANEDKSVWGYAQSNSLMEWNLFVRAIEQIMDFEEPVKHISLSNHGEPLCNRRVPDMVRYIKGKGIKSRVSIHTNASLLDEEYVSNLADSQIDKVVVSLQGMSAEKYHQVCGVSLDVDRLYDMLRLFHEKKTNTALYIKIADVALEQGEEELFYAKFLPIADRVFVEKTVPIWKGTEFSEQQAKVMVKNKYGAKFPKQVCCPVLFHTLTVTPMGDVYPCTQLLSKNSLGNIMESTLVQMWNSKERKMLLREQLELCTAEICEGCYIKDNSIFTEEDLIDSYRDDILKRLLDNK